MKALNDQHSDSVKMAILLLLFITGCKDPGLDVTYHPAFGNFGASMVGVWKTKVSTTLNPAVDEYMSSSRLYLSLYDHGKKLDEIPAGTKISIDEMVYVQGFSVDVLLVNGRIIDGKYSGREITLGREFFPFETMHLYKTHHKNNQIAKPPWSAEVDKLEKVPDALRSQ
jgi:hypothetical protein